MQYKLATPEQQAELDDLRATWPLAGPNILQIPSSPEVHEHYHPSIVIIGAYKGKLMQWFAERYPTAYITGFEPQQWAINEAYTRLQPYAPRISFHNFALVIDNELANAQSNTQTLYQAETDAASLLPSTSPASDTLPTLEVETYEANRMLKHLPSPIDLLIMNIEGYEYTLLPHIYTFLHEHVESLAVQFHTAAEPSLSHYASILHTLDTNTNFVNHFNYFLPSWGYWYN